MGAMKGERVVGASKPAFYPRNQGSSGAFRSGFAVSVGMPMRPGSKSCDSDAT